MPRNTANPKPNRNRERPRANKENNKNPNKNSELEKKYQTRETFAQRARITPKSARRTHPIWAKPLFRLMF